MHAFKNTAENDRPTAKNQNPCAGATEALRLFYKTLADHQKLFLNAF